VLGSDQLPFVVLLLIHGQAALQPLFLADSNDFAFSEAQVVDLDFELLLLLTLLVTHLNIFYYNK